MPLKQTVINLELTGRCNRRCIVCPQADPESEIPRVDMSLEDHQLFLDRVDEAMRHGLFVREIINAGYGETFIHAQLDAVFALYADFLAQFARTYGRRPDVSIVTNGSAISEERLAAVCQATDILKFSFPTSDPGEYGRIMLGRPERGAALMRVAEESLQRAMMAWALGRIRELRVHISPPVAHAHENFHVTLEYLAKLARDSGLTALRVVTFPSTSNRAGSVAEEGFLNDFYRGHKKLYDGREISGVRVTMLSEFNVFYPKMRHALAVLQQPFPCLWKAGSLSIDATGMYRHCINDAETRYPVGDLPRHGIHDMWAGLRRGGPWPDCANCNQNPSAMGDDWIQRLYSFAARQRMRKCALW